MTWNECSPALTGFSVALMVTHTIKHSCSHLFRLLSPHRSQVTLNLVICMTVVLCQTGQQRPPTEEQSDWRVSQDHFWLCAQACLMSGSDTGHVAPGCISASLFMFFTLLILLLHSLLFPPPIAISQSPLRLCLHLLFCTYVYIFHPLAVLLDTFQSLPTYLFIGIY